MEILRDGFGIPHCYADSEDEAFFAQGWVHAADRLWQMEYDRRRATGRMAEAVGASAVASDVFHRRLDLSSFVRADHGALASDTIAMLGAYARGVNAWAEVHPLPREFAAAGVDFERWEPWHSLLVFRVRHLLMGSARSKLWRSVVRDVLGADLAHTMTTGRGADHIACVPPGAPCVADAVVGFGDVDGGSNNWVLAGARTASGMPMLAGDPHRELEAPNVYVQGHVACPSWDVLGLGLPGVPGFPHFGHNERVAWSITHAMADDQDLYTFTPGAFPAVRTEVISVRDGDAVDVDVVVTPRGPLIADDLALSWTAIAEVNLGFDAIAPMLRATSVEALFEANRPWVEPVNSLLAADVDGNIGYLLRGRLPLRRRPDAAWFPVSGDDDSYGWDGWVAFEDLPRSDNPAEGFLFSANNQISSSPSAPYVALDVAPPWRATRIVELAGSLEGATVEAMAEMHRDVVSLPARRVLARLGDWAPVAGWDGSMSSASPAAGAYAVFRRELLRVVVERSGLAAAFEHPRNRVLPGVVAESVLWRVVEQLAHDDDPSLLQGWTWDDAFSAARRRADAAWHGERWGELHQTRQRHVLGGIDASLHPARSVEVGGDLDTVFATGYLPTVDLAARSGSVARYAFDLANWDRSGWVVPLGAAGAPPDPHAGDQQSAWAAGHLLPAPYTRAAVEAAVG